MKYYLIERHYDLKGKVYAENRITGDTEDLSWAKKQMEYRFNRKIIDYRHDIKPGAVTFSEFKNELLLKTGKYELEIIKLTEKPSARMVLLALNKLHKGNFLTMYQDLVHKTFDPELVYKQSIEASNAVTIIDQEFPQTIKTVVPQPPMVLYYQGDLNLIDSTNYVRLTVMASRETDNQLLYKASQDIKKLPANYVIITSHPDIVDTCLFGENTHKVILIKPCGLNKTCPKITSKRETQIIQQGGLVITPYPDDVEAEPDHFVVKNKLMGCLGKGSLIVCSGAPQSSANIIISFGLQAGRDIMVYPTWPEYKNTMNNRLISEGAILVENADDIINTLEK